MRMILAVANNGVIGNKGALPWHIPADLRWFKKWTTGQTLIMGKRTWESVGNLPDRKIFVVSREHVPDVRLLLDIPGDPIVCGGRSLFIETLPLCHTVYFTRIHADYEGDVRVDLDFSEFQVMEYELHQGDVRLEFFVYRRPT